MGSTSRWIGLVATGLGATFTARALRERRKIEFRDKVVLITGGSRGQGLILARQLGDEGARLALIARDEDELERARQELQGRGAKVLAFTCDVREQAEAEGAIERVVKHYGRIDVLINNAGVITVGPIEHMELEDFEDAMAVHMWGPLYTMRAAIPHMRKQGGGRIVNISSIGGRIAVPHLVPYSASKFALVGLSDGMRAELAKDNIRVTTVCPGLIRTGSPPNVFIKGQHKKEYAWFVTSDALPLLSMDATRAASQIVEATRYGDPHLTISTQARILESMNNLFPSLTANLIAFMSRLLPSPTDASGDQIKTGWESQSALAPSLLTRLSDEATVENNELHGHPSVVENASEVSAS